MRKYFLLLSLFVALQGWAASLISEPTIDFGTIGYVAGSGNNTITLPVEGAPTTSGVGGIYRYTAGSTGNLVVGNWGIFDWLAGVRLNTAASTAWQTVTTSNCGTVKINNFVTTGNDTTASASASGSNATFPIGGTLQLDSFTGKKRCTISGAVNNLVQYQVWGTTKVPVNITVEIIPYMSLSHDSAALDFGTICSSSQAQTIVVDRNGNSTSTNAACPNPGTSADSFTVKGVEDQYFTISLPASLDLENDDGDTLAVTNLNADCTSGCTMGSSGQMTVKVGGTLTVPARAPKGDYTGHYTVSLAY